MKVIKTSDLRRLDVVSVEEGRYLGSVCDVIWTRRLGASTP